MNQLESALLVNLRTAVSWEASVRTDSSGTLTPINPEETFSALDYQQRDRELAFRDTIVAAAVVEVSVEVSDVWQAEALRPLMEGPQRTALPWHAADARNVNSQVLHVKNVHVAYDAARYADRDLYGRDALVYEVLAQACGQMFTNPPITPATGGAVTGVTAWSLASGTHARADINPALPMNRDLFRTPDQNLADRDNQLAGYVARLVQVLKNPFAYAERLYVQITGTGTRETETYTFIRNYFVAGTLYGLGDEVFYQTGYYRATAATTELPTNATYWTAISAPTQRVFAVEPRLTNRNRIVYDTDAQTLQWLYEDSSIVSVPQIYALDIPGVLPGQRVRTVPAVPERKDAYFWRQKAARFVPAETAWQPYAAIDVTSSASVEGGQSQLTGASFTIPSTMVFDFDGTLPPGDYRVALLAGANAEVEIAGAQNTDGVSGTLGGASYGTIGRLVNWAIGLPPGAWTFEIDYTNLTGLTNGFRISADLSGVALIDDVAPLYFNDAFGQPLPNGSVVSSVPVPIAPTGASQILGIQWTGGTGDFHVRALRFTRTDASLSRYSLSGTLGDAVGYAGVIGQDKQTDTIFIDFSPTQVTQARCTLELGNEATLPLRLPMAQLLVNAPGTATPSAEGFAGFRSDCVNRAERSIQDSFRKSVIAFGTNTPAFTPADGVWTPASSDAWMAFIESAEPRLRSIPGISNGQLVSGRLYQVAAGTVAYFGTYVAGAYFTGTWTGAAGTSYTDLTGVSSVNQVGATILARCGQVDQPALLPEGLYYNADAGTIGATSSGSLLTPRMATLEPWMVAAGLYSFAEDFWSPRSF